MTDFLMDVKKRMLIYDRQLTDTIVCKINKTSVFYFKFAQMTSLLTLASWFDR